MLLLLSDIRAEIVAAYSHAQTLLDLSSASSFRTTARARNDGSLKSTQVAQDDVSRRPVSVFKNDSGSTGLAVLPNPTANETKVGAVILCFWLQKGFTPRACLSVNKCLFQTLSGLQNLCSTQWLDQLSPSEFQKFRPSGRPASSCKASDFLIFSITY